MKQNDVDILIPKDNLVEFARSFLSEYLKDGFGAQPKRHTDLHVFHLLERLVPLENLDNHDVSHKLKITESKVKALRYESKLRFVPVEEKYIERRILYSLAKSEFNVGKGEIKFIVEDPYVRKSLQAISKKLGGVPDSSFNSEIVNISASDLQKLMLKLFGEEISNNFMDKIEQLKKQNSKITYADVRKAIVLGAAKGLGSGAVIWAKTLFGLPV